MTHRNRWFTGLPIKNGGSFHGKLLVITRCWHIIWESAGYILFSTREPPTWKNIHSVTPNCRTGRKSPLHHYIISCSALEPVAAFKMSRRFRMHRKDGVFFYLQFLLCCLSISIVQSSAVSEYFLCLYSIDFYLYDMMIMMIMMTCGSILRRLQTHPTSRNQ